LRQHLWGLGTAASDISVGASSVGNLAEIWAKLFSRCAVAKVQPRRFNPYNARLESRTDCADVGA
jgi:hypothetical protein